MHLVLLLPSTSLYFSANGESHNLWFLSAFRTKTQEFFIILRPAGEEALGKPEEQRQVDAAPKPRMPLTASPTQGRPLPSYLSPRRNETLDMAQGGPRKTAQGLEEPNCPIPTCRTLSLVNYG